MFGNEVVNEPHIIGRDHPAAEGQHRVHDHFVPEMALERKLENGGLTHFRIGRQSGSAWVHEGLPPLINT